MRQCLSNVYHHLQGHHTYLYEILTPATPLPRYFPPFANLRPFSINTLPDVRFGSNK